MEICLRRSVDECPVGFISSVCLEHGRNPQLDLMIAWQKGREIDNDLKPDSAGFPMDLPLQ